MGISPAVSFTSWAAGLRSPTSEPIAAPNALARAAAPAAAAPVAPFPAPAPTFRSSCLQRRSHKSRAKTFREGIRKNMLSLQETTAAEAFAGALSAPPMAFNSERGRFGRYVRAINSVQDYIDCLFGPY